MAGAIQSVVAVNGLRKFSDVPQASLRVHLCTALPGTIGDVSTYSLGYKANVVATVPEAAATGRRVSFSGITGGAVLTSGTATHYAVTNGTSELLAASTLSASVVVTAGGTFSLSAFTVTVNHTDSSGSKLFDNMLDDGLSLLTDGPVGEYRVFLTTAAPADSSSVPTNPVGVAQVTSFVGPISGSPGTVIQIVDIDTGVAVLEGGTANYAVLIRYNTPGVPTGLCYSELVIPVTLASGDTFDVQDFQVMYRHTDV